MINIFIRNFAFWLDRNGHLTLRKNGGVQKEGTEFLLRMKKELLM